MNWLKIYFLPCAKIVAADVNPLWFYFKIEEK